MKQTVKLKLGMLGILTLLFFLVGCGGPKDVSFDLDGHNNTRASITTVSNFGSNPGNLKMYQYIPANPKPNAAFSSCFTRLHPKCLRICYPNRWNDWLITWFLCYLCRAKQF